MIEIAVVGGGPAGAYCAYNLARNGLRVSIFDDSHPREKPCGGMLTPEALDLFPFIAEIPIEQRILRKGHFKSPTGIDACTSTKNRPYRAFSRSKLDQFLIEMASDEGTDWIKEKVVSVERRRNLWKITTSKSQYHARILIGADGHNSLVRKTLIGQLSRKDFGLAFGYILSNFNKDEFTIRFLPRRKGYMWLIPRTNHTCAGIGCSELALAYGLKKELDAFLHSEYPHLEIISRWASLIPNIKKPETFNKPLAGKNWIIIGDAAGHVDPITGEGIPFALLDGDLAASAIIENKPTAFDSMWREAFGLRMLLNIQIRNIYYHKLTLESLCTFNRIANKIIV
jgi:geranylgeranyl reductase family protein